VPFAIDTLEAKIGRTASIETILPPYPRVPFLSFEIPGTSRVIGLEKAKNPYQNGVDFVVSAITGRGP